MANPKIKFGVNCYGVKPVPSLKEIMEMNAKRVKPDNKKFNALDKDLDLSAEVFDKLFTAHKQFEFINSFFVDTNEIANYGINLYNNFDKIEESKNIKDYIEKCIIRGSVNG